MSSDFARAPIGERAVVSEPKNKGKNISLVGAISLAGIVAMMYCLCTMDAIGFLGFINDYLVPNLRAGQIVIMDNINFHCGVAVREAIEAVGASVVFLPPYSPELNPIENMWSKIKSYLKKKSASTLAEFHISFSEAIDSVTNYDCEGWFDNSGYI